MLFLFGINSYVRKTVYPSELTIAVPDDIRCFECRQHYFHLFFLPVAPVNIDWVVRKKQNSKVAYKVNELHEEALWDLYNPGTPFMCFLLPILLLTGLLAFFLVNIISTEIKSFDGSYVSREEENSIEIREKLNHAVVNDYLRFGRKVFGEQEQAVYAKVLAVKDSALLLQVADTANVRIYRGDQLFDMFDDADDAILPEWVRIEPLRGITSRGRNMALFGAKNLSLKEVGHIEDNRIFSIRKVNSYGEADELVMEHTGRNMTITAVRNLEGKIAPADKTMQAPYELPTLFSLKYHIVNTDSTARFRVTCRDKKGRDTYYTVAVRSDKESLEIRRDSL